MKCYFFGTFNPVHIGHIEISKFVIENTNFKEVIFVPAYNPPHKNIFNFEDRVNMLKINGLKVSEIEKEFEGITYTYKIIEKLGKSAFIIGYDAFLEIESWKNPEYLKEMLHFIVIPRKTHHDVTKFAKLKEKGYDFEILDFKPIDVSSEEIRERIVNKKDVSKFITKETEEYINGHRIYQNLAQRKSNS